VRSSKKEQEAFENVFIAPCFTSGEGDRTLNLQATQSIFAAAGIQRCSGRAKIVKDWIPACAGMTYGKELVPWKGASLCRTFGVLLALVVVVAQPGVCLADYAVQVGAFRSVALLSERIERIDRAGFPTLIERTEQRGKPVLTTVLVGPYEDSVEAEAARKALLRSGFEGFVRIYHQGISEAQKNQSSRLDPTRYARADSNAYPPPLESNNGALILGSGVQLAAASPASEPAQPSSSAPSKPQSPGLPFTLSGHAQTAVAYTVASPDHWSKIKNTLHLAVERALATDINLKISGRFSYDGAYDVSKFYPDRVKRDQRWQAMFHETYLDVGLNDWNFRLGRQNIVWGEVIGLFFADVVTAKDLREFLVPEFDYIRVPQWATRAEYFTGDFKAEAIWIPYMTYDQIGKPGSEFYPFTIPPPPGFRQIIRSERTPHSLRDSSFGLRASYLVGGWDLAAFYYGSMDANSTFFRSTILAPVPTVRYRPDHERIHQTGLTLSKDAGAFVFKAEAIYTWDRYFNVINASDSNGVVRQDFLDYIVSAEIPLPMESRINLQFFQRLFTNHDHDIIPRRIESGASLLASTKLFNDKVEPELLMIQSLNRLDYMTRFKINWSFAKDWRFVAGAAFFGGKKLGLFGQFGNRDRVFTEIRYSF
jgi:hypothetical protein